MRSFSSALFGALYGFALVAGLSSSASADEGVAPSAGSSRTNTFNPDLSFNALMLYQNSTWGHDSRYVDRNGASLQEAELQVTSDVDPYWRLVGTLSIHQDENSTGRDWQLEPEEAYAESIDLPIFTVRAGKFKAAMGKHNQLHTHAFPFIDAPLINTYLLGSEGLNDAGLSAAALLPAPWFSEITFQAFSGQDDSLKYFDGPHASNLTGLVHLKNLWDLSDDLTAEFGLSAATGENQNANSTELYGSDLTFKWRPDGSRTKAVIWQTEALDRQLGNKAGQPNESGVGYASWIQYQFALRWWVQVRDEYLQVRNHVAFADVFDDTTPFQRKESLLLAYVPSEFSALRIQYDHRNNGMRPDEHKVMLQLNFTIGAHPAHAY